MVLTVNFELDVRVTLGSVHPLPDENRWFFRVRVPDRVSSTSHLHKVFRCDVREGRRYLDGVFRPNHGQNGDPRTQKYHREIPPPVRLSHYSGEGWETRKNRRLLLTQSP